MNRIAWTIVGILLASSTLAAEPWTTYRGDSWCSGNADGKAGPTKPDVLWVYKSQENFVAAPVPVANRLLLPGFSGFNVPTLFSFDTDPRAPRRIAWSKGVPVFKLPLVGSPAIAGDKLIFGDGMHQTSGAILHCLTAAGQLVWQFPVPGNLVHLEGTPTVAGGKVYVGGGAAGVLCLDIERITLDGKERKIPEVRKILDAKWKKLQIKYEEDKKKDLCFAVAPSEDQLPKPAPVKLWQPGRRQRRPSHGGGLYRQPMKGLPMSRSPLLVVMALLVFVPATRAEDKKTGIVVDKRKRAVIIDARVAPRKITDPAYMGKIYPIELLSGSRSFAGRGRSSWPAANRSQPNARATHRMETGSLPE